MALNDMLTTKKTVKMGISKERIQAIMPILRQYIAFWREYPDLFIDFLLTGGRPILIEENGTKYFLLPSGEKVRVRFSLYSYQRIFLRVGMRYKYVYCVYPRAYSKSFLSVLIIMIKCILYPGAHLFSAAGGKEQSSSILQEKTQDICTKIPALKKEINWDRGKGTLEGRDHCRYQLKNGSNYENLAARESTRGMRKHAGLLEECVGIDQKILQEVLIPLMNVSRQCMDGTTHDEEILNQSQLYITTAGQKGSFSYEKLIQTLVQMIVENDKAYILGGTWRIPVLMGLQAKTFISDLRKDPTFNEASFEREYESKWTGNADNAFFNGEVFDKYRILSKAETEASDTRAKNAYYVMGVDVGRKGCQSVAIILKVNPQSQNNSIKNIVNIYTYEDMHFEDQAIELKKLYYKYKCRRMVLDGNGLGIGLVDYMVKQQTDKYGETIPDFGIINDPDNYYSRFETDITERDAIYIVKAKAAFNTEAYSIVQSDLNTGKLKFLIEARLANTKLLSTTNGKAMSPEQRAEYLRPYELTNILKEEMINLREETEGVNIILKQTNKRILKDKFSALCYGLYYIKKEEDGKRHRRTYKLSGMMFMS